MADEDKRDSKTNVSANVLEVLPGDQPAVTEVPPGLQRKLKGRHVVFISLGSIIGPGTFFALGYGLQLSGPLGIFLGFLITGILVCVMMQGMGEVTTAYPIKGGWVEHASEFVDPAFSFATTWLYYIMWGFFAASETNTAIQILAYWVPQSTMPPWAWCLIFYALFNIICQFSVRIYGEVEFFLSLYKFLMVLVIIVLCIVANARGFSGHHEYIGFKYWDPPIRNGVQGFGQIFVLASTYYVGTEVISLNAAETANPRRDVPRGVRSIVARIFFVYCGLTFFANMVCPADDPALLSAGNATSSSPFTIGFQHAGWAGSADFVNSIILITYFSACNGCIYIMSRCLYSMATTKRAPKFFAKLSRAGVPYRAVAVSCLFILLMLMQLGSSAGTVFGYFTSISGTACFIAWIGMTWTHIAFRRAMKVQGISQKELPFKGLFTMPVYYVALFLWIFLLFIQSGFTSFVDGFHWKTFVTTYITIPTWVVLFVGYKWVHKTHWKRANEVDLSGLQLLQPDEVIRKESGKEAL